MASAWEVTRTETRRQRQDKRASLAKTLPVSVCMTNFGLDVNLALAIRSAACYGAESVMVIGSIPDRSFLRPRSGTTVDLIKVHQFPNPHEFMDFCRKEDYDIISAEICDNARDLNDFEFRFDKRTVIVTGNESNGVPAEITHNSKCVYINTLGPAFCLNTAITSSIFLNEYNRQYSKK